MTEKQPLAQQVCLSLLLLCNLLLLTGCNNDSPTAKFDNYLSRLARGLEQPTPTLNIDWTWWQYPSRSARWITPQDIRLNFLAILSIKHCHSLTQRIAERNSALGKVMPITQQAIYERQLLPELSACLQHPESTSAELRETLRQWMTVKQAQLPSIYWNALYNSSEMLHHFSLATPPLSDHPPSLTPTLQALSYLTTFSQQRDTPIQDVHMLSQQLNQHLQKLQQRATGGELIRASVLANTMLKKANQLMTAVSVQQICPQHRPTPQARILSQVLQKFYLQQVQPYLAQLSQQLNQWQIAHQHLLKTLPHENIPPAMKQFIAKTVADNTGLHATLKQQTTRHIAYWKQILKQCAIPVSSLRRHSS
ncbi:DUF3080 family protein [Zooshikella harenae]|uniref:DUF3080 family protein n=1 Tax=Zooshikella harenae TaxID=2827238 RepID=A0ABS5Z705_9GAMM|nr:DUF3080 family protein [Zooshikella harenae]MBU2709832.1 DUF3080 family protein [Zooshikella harenae]